MYTYVHKPNLEGESNDEGKEQMTIIMIATNGSRHGFGFTLVYDSEPIHPHTQIRTYTHASLISVSFRLLVDCRH